jgi:hypothetical protein
MEGISFASRTQKGTSKGASQVAGEGLRTGPKLTLISAPAGFGKTTLLSKWVAGCTGEMVVA